MLILTRRTGESTDLTVPPSTTETKMKMTILGVKGNQVRFGIAAPRSVIIDREEITERKKLEGDCPECGFHGGRHKRSCSQDNAGNRA